MYDIVYVDNSLLEPFPPPTNRRNSDITDEWARTNTRFTKDELRLLLLHLRIPIKFRTKFGHVLSGETVLLISLVYMAHATPFYLLSEKFAGNPREFGSFFKLFCDHLYTTFYHRISGDSLRSYVHRIDDYRYAIWKRLVEGPANMEITYDSDLRSPIYRLVWLPFHQFRVFGFLDCTDIRMFRPQDNPNDPSAGHDLQRSFYSRTVSNFKLLCFRMVLLVVYLVALYVTTITECSTCRI